MKKNKLFNILGIALLFILMLSIAACGKKANPICHTWVLTDDSFTEKYTFYKDGSGIYEGYGYKESFKWKTYDNGYIEIVTGNSVVDVNYDVETYQYSIRNNGRELLLDDYVYTRAK